MVVTGVNDVVGRLPPSRAAAARTALHAWLVRERGARHVVYSTVPPMGEFRGLPQPLRWFAGRDARAHDAALAEHGGGAVWPTIRNIAAEKSF